MSTYRINIVVVIQSACIVIWAGRLIYAKYCLHVLTIIIMFIRITVTRKCAGRGISARFVKVTCVTDIPTYPQNHSLMLSPGHIPPDMPPDIFPSPAIPPPFLYGVGHFPLPPSPSANLQYKAIYR